MYLLYAVMIMKVVGLGIFLTTQCWSEKEAQRRREEVVLFKNLHDAFDEMFLRKNSTEFNMLADKVSDFMKAYSKINDHLTNVGIPNFNKLAIEVNKSFKEAIAKQFGSQGTMEIKSTDVSAVILTEEGVDVIPLTSYDIIKENDRNDFL